MKSKVEYPSLLHVLKCKESRRDILLEPLFVCLVVFVLLILTFSFTFKLFFLIVVLSSLISINFNYQKNKAFFYNKYFEMYLYDFFSFSPVLLALSFYLAFTIK